MVAFNVLTWLATWGSKYLPNAENLVKTESAAPQPPSSGAQPAPAADASYEPAPDVELKTIDGRAFRLSEYRGRVVLLNFWATWCGPCKAEIPALNALNRELAPRGFEVVGVTTQDTPQLVRQYQKDFKQEYTVAFGDESVATSYAVGVLPTTFFIDRQGRVRQTVIGEKTRAYFESVLGPLLDEPAPGD
jgi:thiol-disulfide isomerase/thioredoxin